MMNRIPRRALLGGLAGACVAAHPALAAEPAGAVETSRGECFAKAAAARRTLAPAAQVFIGDTVGTGAQSALGLHLGTATQVKLGAELQLRIDRFVVNAGGILVLERGGMVYDHDQSGGPSDVALRTPFGLVAVRGTRFFAGPSNGVFGVFVERGEVTVVVQHLGGGDERVWHRSRAARRGAHAAAPVGCGPHRRRDGVGQLEQFQVDRNRIRV